MARIDLGYLPGRPPFLDVLRAVASELVIERAVIAIEAAPDLADEIGRTAASPTDRISHEELKELGHRCRAAIRTGEYTPYANVIVVPGVDFG